MKYKTCPRCKAHLDHGEACPCRNTKEAAPVTRGRPQGRYATATIIHDGAKNATTKPENYYWG